MDAFAHVTQSSSRRLIEQIGHDGSERGFNTQELIEVLIEEWSIIEIQRQPIAVNPITGEKTEITFGHLGSEPRFVKWLKEYNGVLLGLNSKHTEHAVSWLNQKVYDPNTGLSFELLKKNSAGSWGSIKRIDYFTPTKFLIVRKT